MSAPLDPKVQFEHDWAKRRLADQRPARRRSMVDFDSVFVQEALTQRDLVRRRLDPNIGFIWPGGMIGDYFVPAVSEVGLLTQDPDAHVARRFVQLTPRAGRGVERLHTGYQKGRIKPASSKLLGLDEPYIQLNTVMRGGWRIDLDRNWICWDELRFDIECLVDDRKLPCLPHAVVAWESPANEVIRPHLWWLLPYGSAVWYDPDDKRCSRRIMSLYRGVVAGCNGALDDLGADASAASLPLKGKNPLSPLWSARFWNQEHFPDLSEWSDYVNTSLTAGKLARAAAAKESKGSSTEFEALQRLAFAQLRAFHASQDATYLAHLGDRAALAEYLSESCRHDIAAMASDDAERRRLFAISGRVVPYAAAAWRPSRARHEVDVGACADRLHGLDRPAKQAVGAKYAAEQNAYRCRSIVMAAVEACRRDGFEPTKSEIATQVELSRPTVSKWWPQDQPTTAGRKKRSIDPLAARDSEHGGQPTTAPASAVEIETEEDPSSPTACARGPPTVA